MSNFKLSPGESFAIDPQANEMGDSILPTTDDQKKLRRLIDRRHPEYAEQVDHWNFLEDTYEGGREWFKENIFRYLKEGDQEYGDRLVRAYRFNHSREVVDLLNKYLFKQNIQRNTDDAPQSVKNFWEKSTRNGLGIKDFARQISKKTSIYGRVGVVIDNTGNISEVLSKADEKKSGVKTYGYVVSPTQLLDYAYDNDGELEWALIEEAIRDDKDPLNSSGDEEVRFRLWAKQSWQLYQEVREGKKKVVKLIDQGVHGLGKVPVIIADNAVTDEEYCAPSLIGDIAYLDRAVANYLSNLDAIIQDQTFSQLAMPAQGVIPGEDNYTKLLEMGTKRMFLYNGEAGKGPEYLSPDPKQAQMILSAVNKIISEIYHTVGLAGERTKQDNAMGIDNSSGVAKAYDFERVNALLAAKADSLEVIENKIVELVALWNNEQKSLKGNLVSYPDDFDTRGLYDEFDIAARLMLIDAPENVRQEQMKLVLDKLFPQLGSEKRAEMDKSLKDWPTDPLEAEPAVAGSTDKKAVASQKDSQQGSNQKTKADQRADDSK